MKIAHAVAGSLAVALVAGACAQFSSGQCTDKALCDPNEASTLDNTAGDVPVIDVNIDTFVGPDGNVPDGECNGGAEDCANGKDDNCNGLIDCADPVCQGASYSCTPAVPSGWAGPVAWFNIAGDTIPSCAIPYLTPDSSGHFGINAPAAQCNCGCGTPTGVTCNQVNVGYYSDSNCQTNVGSAGLPTNFCVSTGTGSYVSGTATATAFNGTCSSNPSKTLPAISWQQSMAVCGYNATTTNTGGCTGGSLCVQAPPSGAYAKSCVYQAGDVACPGAGYTQKALFYTSISDSRSCSSCTCTASAGTCNAQITVYSQSGCQTGGTMLGVATDGTCHPFSALSAIAGSISVTPGTCGSNGTGAPTGSASATSPVTVCCP